MTIVKRAHKGPPIDPLSGTLLNARIGYWQCKFSGREYGTRALLQGFTVYCSTDIEGPIWIGIYSDLPGPGARGNVRLSGNSLYFPIACKVP